MAINDKHKLESVFVQRNPNNTQYEQINISGSDLIIYHSSSGELVADRISEWASKYNIGGGGSSDTASYVAFNGDRPITRDDPDFLGLNVGGDNVVAFLNNFFFPFLPATISINSGTTYYETGSAHEITIAGSITANSETIFGTTGSVRRSGVDWETFPSASTYSVRDPVTGSNGVSGYSYEAFFSTDNNGSPTVIDSATKTITFIFPYLYGTSTTAGLTGTALYSALTGLVQTQGGSKTVNMSGTTTYMYFCFPSSYDSLNSIKDPNLFEILTAFEYSASVPVTSSGLEVDWMQTYKVYRTEIQSDPNGNYIFTHS